MYETSTETGTDGDAPLLVHVRGIAAGGAAVGRVTGPEMAPEVGMTVFVPFAAPGEDVRVRVRRRHARHLEAELTEIVTASPDRVPAPCPYFGECGGCDLQHLAYAAQIAAKAEMVQGAFRAGGFRDEVLGRIATPVAGPEYGYRRRITLHVAADGSLGYHPRRSSSVLPVAMCPIADAAIQRFLSEGFSLAGVVPQHAAADLVVAAEGGRLFGVLRLDAAADNGKAVAERAVERMRSRFDGGGIQVGGETVGRFGSDGWEALGEFAQANAVINGDLIEHVRRFAAETGTKTALDLYAGAGNFALPLAAMGIATTAVEIAPALVAAGRRAAREGGLDGRLHFVENAVERFLRKRPSTVDLTVADPPRAGLGRLVPYFSDLSSHLALISCDLASAVRDVRDLTSSGWKVQQIAPFDMFAQTAHLELLITLARG